MRSWAPGRPSAPSACGWRADASRHPASAGGACVRLSVRRTATAARSGRRWTPPSPEDAPRPNPHPLRACEARPSVPTRDGKGKLHRRQPTLPQCTGEGWHNLGSRRTFAGGRAQGVSGAPGENTSGGGWSSLTVKRPRPETCFEIARERDPHPLVNSPFRS